MQYALLAYGRQADRAEIDSAIADVLAQDPVVGWIRLFADESATTVAGSGDQVLLTDGPFIDAKEYLAGVILVEAADLDGAIAVARQLQESRTAGAIEIRPVLQSVLDGA